MVRKRSKSKAKISSRAERWKKQNPWFGTDEQKTAFALAVHKELIAAGVDPQGPRYYKSIDAAVQLIFAEREREIAVCKTCGSENVTSDALARWDEDCQEWALECVLDNADCCADCGGQTTIVWKTAKTKEK